jgi:hypothetical protein
MSIQIPIGGNILHPPLGILQRELIPGLFTGSGDLTRPGPTPPFNNVNAVGLSWSFFTVPAPFGYRVGDPIIYYERMIQLSTIHQDIGTHQLVSEVYDAYADGHYWMWQEAGPSRVHYEICPGVDVVFYWLII